jgi:uncharacterized protein (DUF305 family)
VTIRRHSFVRPALRSFAATFLIAAAVGASAQTAPIVQPGAPGQPPRPLSAQEAAQIANTRFSPDDVRFMQTMIPHHHQAVQMVALVPERTNRPAILDAARRIEASQADEIAFMQSWLRERGQPVPDPSAPHSTHGAHGPGAMKGMATPQQMAELAAASGIAFDRLFLQLMIDHHSGAVEMARDLLERPGSAYDPVLFDFVNEVVDDQNAEIERMIVVLAGLTDDPRSRLKAGFRDAEQAISNLQLVASLPKPPGFFDPANPAGLPPKPTKPEADADAPKKPAGERDARSPLLSFANTDMAFSATCWRSAAITASTSTGWTEAACRS